MPRREWAETLQEPAVAWADNARQAALEVGMGEDAVRRALKKPALRDKLMPNGTGGKIDLRALYEYGLEVRDKTSPAEETEADRYRTEKLRWQARQAKTDAERQEGKLVDIGLAVKAIDDVLVPFGRRVQELPRRLASSLVGEDAAGIERILKTRIDELVVAFEAELARLPDRAKEFGAAAQAGKKRGGGAPAADDGD